MSTMRATGGSAGNHRPAPTEPPKVEQAVTSPGSDGSDEHVQRVTSPRSWYHPRPKPKRPMEVLGFNGLGWAAILVVYVAFELLWWGWLL
jgi:hypothetical protein